MGVMVVAIICECDILLIVEGETRHIETGTALNNLYMAYTLSKTMTLCHR